MKDVSWSERYRMSGTAPRGDAMEAFRGIGGDGREVVIKVTRPRDPDRFLHQMEAAGRVEHPNVARVVDWGKDGDMCWVATEPVDGVDLRAVLTSEGRLSSQAAAVLGEQAAAGLGALHAVGVIHGGVAPHTVIRSFDGTVKLVDVGLRAAIVPVDLGKTSPAALAWYTSPEEAMNQPLVPASDQYALGEVLYELSTGKRPFGGPDAFAVADMQVGAVAPPPRSVAADIPPSLEAVIERSMQKQPAARYASMADMGRDLQTVAMGAHVAPAMAPPPAEEERSRRWLWFPGSIALLAIIALGIAWALGAFGGGDKVPDVVGKSLDDADKALKADGYKVGKIEYEGDATEDTPGLVVASQSPAAGQEADQGTAVDLKMAAELVEVPDVVGKSEAQAGSDITAAKLTVGDVRQQSSDKVDAGNVISQNPKSGDKVASGTAVDLVVSKGEAPTNVPDVTGDTQTAAKRALEDAGYVVNVTEESSETVPAGIVISQDPAAGVQAAKGSTVTISVSTGPSPTPTPTATPTPTSS